MTTVEASHLRALNRQKRAISKKIKRALRRTYADCCVISVNGLFEETIEWLEKQGFRVYELNERD